MTAFLSCEQKPKCILRAGPTHLGFLLMQVAKLENACQHVIIKCGLDNTIQSPSGPKQAHHLQQR